MRLSCTDMFLFTLGCWDSLHVVRHVSVSAFQCSVSERRNVCLPFGTVLLRLGLVDDYGSYSVPVVHTITLHTLWADGLRVALPPRRLPRRVAPTCSGCSHCLYLPAFLPPLHLPVPACLFSSCAAAA